MKLFKLNKIILSLLCTILANLCFNVANIEQLKLQQHPNYLEVDDTHDLESNSRYLSANKEFWEQMHQNSMFNKKTKYDIINGGNVCFTCPIDRATYDHLYNDARMQSNQSPPPRISISWVSQTGSRVIPFCRNNTKAKTNPFNLMSSSSVNGELEYVCEDNRLCLLNVKNNYPLNYQCLVKSYILDVNLNVVVQLQYVLLYFTGDSVKFDFQKEVQVHENQPFTIECEVPETNPKSNVNAYIDNKELKLTRLTEKTVDNRMSINTYSFNVTATRNMNGKRVRCEARMKDMPSELANSIDLRSHIIKDAILSVYYLPICVYKERVYHTGINRSLIIECPINGSNPDVTYYKMIPPHTRTKFELIDTDLDTLKRVGRYRINPSSQADFGLYECIPRSLAGTAKCDIHVELGDTPNPPEQCIVQFAKVNNKTFAQFSCKPGFNQGGQTSFLTIYEQVDRQLKLSGRVNIDESKIDKEVPYITPADEDKYYEFLIMQENNYGNSTPILLTLGTSQVTKQAVSFESKTIYTIASVAGGIFLLVCVCACCCCNDLCASTKSDNPCCKCCNPSDHNDEDGLTYKKAPMDAVGSSVNQHTFPYNPSDLTSPHIGSNVSHLNSYATNVSNYDYYDNTSTGLLAETNNAYNRRTQQYQSSTKSLLTTAITTKQPVKLSYEANNDVNNYNNNYEDDDDDEEIEEEDDEEEPYMNDTDDILTNKNKNKSTSNNKRANTNINNNKAKNDYDSNNENNSSINENANDTSLTSSSNDGNHPSQHQQQNYATTTTASTATNVTPLGNINRASKPYFNNNVNTLIGSGVESVNKKSSYLNLNGGSSTLKSNNQKASNNNNAKQMNTTNYSTVDTRKYIKTENGLVYTPITNVNAINPNSKMDKNKSTDDLNMNDQKNNSNPYGSIKKVNKNSANASSANIDNNFKNELNQRLKSINMEQQQVQSVEIYSKNYTLSKQKSSLHQPPPLPLTTPVITASTTMTTVNTATEHLTNSTATTSVSSASSCSSNSDLINNTSNKKDNVNVYSSISSNNSSNENNDSAKNNKNYSLLKTTINVNGNNLEEMPLNNKSPNKSAVTNGSYKPPILKPKPKASNIFQSQVNNNQNYHQQQKKLNSTVNDSLNQSHEPLLLNGNHHKETSLQTTPSTSVTDVSSTNCTPQHYNSNILEDITAINNNNRIQQQKQQRSRSNSLNRQPKNHQQTTTTTATTPDASKLNGNSLVTMINGNKATTTFSNANGKTPPVANGKLANGNMKTFSTSNYESASTLNRNGKLNVSTNSNNNNLKSIDDEINMIHSNNNINSKTKLANGLPGINQRTLERRIVKNSEC